MPHYSIAHNPEILSSWSLKAARNIYETFSDKNISTVLIYSGMSGIALATAVQLAYYHEFKKPLQMIYVRKENEISHGNPVEFEYIHRYEYNDRSECNLIFVDDFIDSGATLARCLEAFNKHYQPFFDSDDVPEVTDVFYINEYGGQIENVSTITVLKVQDAYAKVEKVKIEK